MEGDNLLRPGKVWEYRTLCTWFDESYAVHVDFFYDTYILMRCMFCFGVLHGGYLELCSAFEFCTVIQHSRN